MEDTIFRWNAFSIFETAPVTSSMVRLGCVRSRHDQAVRFREIDERLVIVFRGAKLPP